MSWHLRYISFLLKGFQEGHIMSPTLPVLHTFLPSSCLVLTSQLSPLPTLCANSHGFLLNSPSVACPTPPTRTPQTHPSFLLLVDVRGKALHGYQVSTLLQHLINYFHPITSVSSSSCCHVQSLSSQDRTPDNPYFSELV